MERSRTNGTKENYISRIAVSLTAGLLLLSLYYLIFFLSGQDGEESGGLSAFISEKCVQLFNYLTSRHWTEAFMQSMAEYFEHPIRKLAHFGEYAVMGILLYLVWRPWKERGRKLYLLIVFWVFFSAAGDELHQYFVPGRYGSFLDVLLDTSGGAFGMCLCILAEKFAQRRKQKKDFPVL